MRNKLVLCHCGDAEHQFIMSYDPDEKEPSFRAVYFQVHITRWEGFFRRLWIGLKYAFGYRSRYGEFDEIIINPERAYDIKAFLEEYLSSIDPYAEAPTILEQER